MIKCSLQLMGAQFLQMGLEFGNLGFLRGKGREPGEKPIRARTRTNNKPTGPQGYRHKLSRGYPLYKVSYL